MSRRSLSPVAAPWLCRLTAVACLFGAEAIHVAVMDEHVNEWLPAGLFFLSLALIEGVLSVALIAVPSLTVERLVVAVSLITVAVWLLSRTLGLPIGPMAGVAEPVSRPDMVASVLELITAAVLLAKTTGTNPTRKSATDYLRAALIVCSVVALTAFGVTRGAEHGAPLDLTPRVPAGTGN